MKKKLSLMLCLIIMVLGLSACGIDKETFDFYGLKYSDCELIMSQNVEQITAMSEEELAYYEASADEVYTKLFSGWLTYAPELGAYQGMGEFSLDKAQDTLTLEQIIKYENRDLCMTFVLEYNYETKQVEIVDTNADLVYTLGEKMTKAGLNTLMGMGTVFVMLIIISLIISCFTLVNKAQKKAEDKKAANTPAPAATAAAPVVAAPQTDDLELVAVIAAAIAAATGSSTDDFVVRSIKRR